MLWEVSLVRVSFINSAAFFFSGKVYVASVNYIWRLASTPITTQIKQLLSSKEYELALHLAVITPHNTLVSLLSLILPEYD
jgi:hypothetical protein